MILVDANLLVYAHVKDFGEHVAARAWLDEQLSIQARVGLPWASLLAFVRLISNPRIFDKPEHPAKAWKQVESWLEADAAWIPSPTSRHARLLGSFMQRTVTRANLVPDAHLAALAIEHGLMLCSSDGDFARFPGLRWENPLARG